MEKDKVWVAVFHNEGTDTYVRVFKSKPSNKFLTNLMKTDFWDDNGHVYLEFLVEQEFTTGE